MGPVKTGFELVAKRDRRREPVDLPTQVPMRPESRGEQRRKPSTDQKRVRHQQQRRTAAWDVYVGRDLSGHGCDSCADPIEGSGVHVTDPVSHQNLYLHHGCAKDAGYTSHTAAAWPPPRPGNNMVPGMPAAGHLARNGYWHPGGIANCGKTPCAEERKQKQGATETTTLEDGSVPASKEQAEDTMIGILKNHRAHNGIWFVPECPDCKRDHPNGFTVASKESHMSRESDILAQMATASLGERQRLATELHRMRAEGSAAAAKAREIDFAAQYVAAVGPMGVTAGSSMSATQVTSESDWLAGAVPDEADPQEIVNEVTAVASMWFDNLHEAVREDDHEFGAQAQGYAFRTAGRFGTQHDIAVDAFMTTAKRLRTLAANPDVPPPAAYDHTNDEGSSLPLAVDNEKTFDSDITATAPATGHHPDTPSMAEGNAPASAVSESSENPIGAGSTSFDKSNHNAPLSDYIDGTPTSWKGSAIQPQYAGLHIVAAKRDVSDEWNFLTADTPVHVTSGSLQVVSEDQDTKDVISDAPSLAEGTTPAGDASEPPIEELRPAGPDVKDGGNETYVDPLNGTKTTPEGTVSAGLRPISALVDAIQRGEASRGRLVAPEARPYLMAMALIETGDENYAGVSGRDMVHYLTQTVGTLTSPQATQALAELQFHLHPRSASLVTAAGPVPPQFQKGNDSNSNSSSSNSDNSNSSSSSDDDDPACKRSGCGHPKSKHSGGTGQCSECSCATFQATADDDSKKDDDSKSSDSSSSSAPAGSGGSKPPWLTNKATSSFRQRVQASLASQSALDPNCLQCRLRSEGAATDHSNHIQQGNPIGAPHPGFAHSPGS